MFADHMCLFRVFQVPELIIIRSADCKIFYKPVIAMSTGGGIRREITMRNLKGLRHKIILTFGPVTYLILMSLFGPLSTNGPLLYHVDKRGLLIFIRSAIGAV